MHRIDDLRRACQNLAPRLDSLNFEERAKLVRSVVDCVTMDAENNVRIDIAIYPERMPGDGDAATNPTGTLWPEIAIRCDVPVALRSSVRNDPRNIAEFSLLGR